MRYGVGTEDLGAAAARLRTAAEAASGAVVPLRTGADGVGGWCDEAAREAAHAFLATVAAAAEGLRTGLADLAGGLSSAAGGYAAAEDAATPRPPAGPGR